MMGVFKKWLQIGLIAVIGMGIGLEVAKLTQKVYLANPTAEIEKVLTIGSSITTLVLNNTPTPTVVKKAIVKKIGDTGPWGVAKQIDEHTWTIRVGMDAKMATPPEILSALNAYRIRNGSQPLTWNGNLAGFAQSRADYLYSIKSTDEHKGFTDFLDNQDGFNKLGFTWLGENISYGYQLAGVHLIEWLYAGDKPHDDNQKDNKWNYVGIGVKGTATCLIFGTGKR